MRVANFRIRPFLVVFITFLNTVLAGTPLDVRVDLRQELFDNGLDTETLESTFAITRHIAVELTISLFADLKRDCPDEDLAGQIGIFFTVYEDDLKREEVLLCHQVTQLLATYATFS